MMALPISGGGFDDPRDIAERDGPLVVLVIQRDLREVGWGDDRQHVANADALVVGLDDARRFR